MNEVLLRPGRAVVLAIAAGLAVAAMAPSAAGAEESWGFEQVTPVEKGSGTVSMMGFVSSPDGKRLMHSAYLPYESESLPVQSAPLSSRYVATRGDAGWGNVAIDSPYGLPWNPVSQAYFTQATFRVSQNLDYALVASMVPLTPDADPDGGGLYLRNTRTGELRLIFTSTSQNGILGMLTTSGYSASSYVANDGQSLLFSWSQEPLVEGAPSGQGQLYSWSSDTGLRYEPHVNGAMVPSTWDPGTDQVGPRDPMPLGQGGVDRVYYQVTGASGPLYVAEGPPGARTDRLVSYSRLVPPPVPPTTPTPTSGRPKAVAADGRFVLFETRDSVPIAGGEPAGIPNVRFLYRFDAEASDPSDEVELVGAFTGASARIVQMSQDGKTIVFYSTVAQAGSPAETQQKLFVWREDHGLKYVYSAAAGSSGTSNTDQLRRLSDNGRFLSFTDNSASLAASFGMANNVSAGCPTITLAPGPCDQTYRYDIESEVLECVSCRTDGVAPLGASGKPFRTNGGGQMVINSYQERTVANDGTVFFTSRDTLLPADRNGGLDDVYAWHPDSGLRLVSRGTPARSARFLDASSDGSAVFVASNDRLAATDRDREVDVYATYAGAGIAGDAAPPTVAPCSGGDCRDAFSSPSGLGVGSADFSGGGNVAPAGRAAALSVSGLKAGRGSAVVLRVRAPGAGRIAVSGARVRGVRKSVGKARTVRVRVVLNAKARRSLSKRKRLSARVRVAFAPRAGRSASKTVRVTFKRPAKRSASSRGAVSKGGR